MICAYVAKPLFNRKKGLVLNRILTEEIKQGLKAKLTYAPFIFNTQRGLYVFMDQQDCKEEISTSLEDFIRKKSINQIQFYTPSSDAAFFYKEVALALNDDASSALSWKNFISSFLIQLDPFNGEIKSVHSLFKDFVHAVKTVGSAAQLTYLKSKMNSLRQRVEIKELFELEE